MDLNPLFNHPNDHIMANTWRLIFEQQPKTSKPKTLPSLPNDFGILEQVLTEYRLIGLTLADDDHNRQLD